MEHFPQPPVDQPDPPPECTWCDGDKIVVVHSIITVDDAIVSIPLLGYETMCPNCHGSGEEPALDDPRIP